MRYVLTAALAFVACKNGDRRGSATPAGDDLTRVAEVYFSTEVSGYVEPCGCTTKPLGGIQRLATVIRSGAEDRALIDAGNLLFPSKPFDDVERDQHILKARVLARVYRQLGAVALNVAEADLANGSAFLKELQREGAVSFVSANVRPVKGGPSVAQSFVRTIGGVRIGVTGAATPERLMPYKESVTAIEYAPAVSAEVKALKKRGAEVVVVLAHTGDAGARELARAVPEIDVILWGPGTPIERDPKAPVRVGDVIVAEAGSQGQHVGRMTISLGDGRVKRPLFFDDAGQREVRRRRLLERKIKAYQMEIDAWSVDPKKAPAVAAKQQQIEKLKADLAQPMPKLTAPSQPHVRIDMIRLTSDIPADPAMTKLLDGYYAQLVAMNAEKGDPAKCQVTDPSIPTYVGTAACVECHEEAYEFWKKTKHAVAWETLEKDNKHFDLTCIGCHTVGYAKPGGFCSIKEVDGRKDVGCEECHGPGSIHVKDEDSDSIKLKTPEATCSGGCHVPEHSDAFVYEKYLREITGPGHELSEG